MGVVTAHTKTDDWQTACYLAVGICEGWCEHTDSISGCMIQGMFVSDVKMEN